MTPVGFNQPENMDVLGILMKISLYLIRLYVQGRAHFTWLFRGGVIALFKYI